jgi:hypothetical protein
MRTSTYTAMVFGSLLGDDSPIAGTPGNETDQKADAQGGTHAGLTLHKGVSTRHDVIAAIGHPQEATSQDGRKVCVWKNRPAPALTVYFDDDDVVVDYRIAS